LPRLSASPLQPTKNLSQAVVISTFTPEQKAEFKAAAAPVYDWFKENVDGGPEIFDALTSAVAATEAAIAEANAKDL